MKIGILGGCGFLGSHVVDLLVERGHEVLVFDDLSSAWIDEDLPRFANRGACYVDRLNQEFVDAEVVVDLALRHPLDRELTLYRLCLERVFAGAWFVLDGAIARTLKRYVVVSSLEIYAVVKTILGHHLRAYSAALAYLHRPPHLDVEFVHLPELYGPRQLPDVGFVAAALNGAGTRYDSGPSFAHLGFVRDAAAVVVDRALRTGHRRPMNWNVGAPCVNADLLRTDLTGIGRADLVERVHRVDEPTQATCLTAIDEVLVETSLKTGLRETVEFYAEIARGES